jgi:hypothetical protein
MCHRARYPVVSVIDLVGMQAKWCYAMPAPNGSIRAKSTYQDNANIREKGKGHTQLRENSI